MCLLCCCCCCSFFLTYNLPYEQISLINCLATLLVTKKVLHWQRRKSEAPQHEDEVFELLFSHMALNLFSEPDQAIDILKVIRQKVNIPLTKVTFFPITVIVHVRVQRKYRFSKFPHQQTAAVILGGVHSHHSTLEILLSTVWHHVAFILPVFLLPSLAHVIKLT